MPDTNTKPLSDTALAALRLRAKNQGGLGAKNSENPSGLHHKTAEGLLNREFIAQNTAGRYLITAAGRDYLKALK